MTSIRATEADYGLGWMHIYPQVHVHGPSIIRGNRKALELLIHAFERALHKSPNAQAEVFANDGEGYRVHVEYVTALANLGSPPYAK